MSARKTARRERNGLTGWWAALRLGGLLLTALSLYLALCLTGPAADWLDWYRFGEPPSLRTSGHPGGPVGAGLAFLARAVLGVPWAGGLALLLLVGGLWHLGTGRPLLGRLLRRWAPLWLFSTAWLAQPAWILDEALGARCGGVPGWLVARGFCALFGVGGARIFLTVLLLTALGWALWPAWQPLAERLGGALGAGLALAGRWLLRLPGTAAHGLAGLTKAAWRGARGAPGHEGARGGEAAAAVDRGGRRRVHLPSSPAEALATPTAAQDVAASSVAPASAGRRGARQTVAAAPADAEEAAAWLELESRTAPSGAGAPLPELSLLSDPPADGSRLEPGLLDSAADLLEATLRSFGVEGEVKDVRPGPVVTTFEYQPASGIKVAQIVQRADDLALAMRARSIRMEAPIPGKAAVGIEIPNPTARMVHLKEVLQGAGERLQLPLAVTLGKDVVGQPVVIDLGAQPHLLVAGSTGSGKSVCLNSIITTLLLRNDPSRVRLILIDPKMLEMNVYNGIPHLLLPVVTDPKEALRALKWMEAQMDHRYRRLARHNVRNIEQYNARVARGEIVSEEGETVSEPMPYYLTIVDELADLMMQLGQDFELPITRLAQKARAVGIHLILATQRPSVNVLTGVIKANIPCRIAFRVIQKNDSRTILDMNGAERLLGHGDMLYLQPGRALPVRVHGAYVGLEECEAVVAHWRRYADLTRPVSLAEEKGGGGEVVGEDDLFEAAKRIVVLHQSGSTSLLQRRLRIGYTRAGRLMDMLEQAGVVGPFTGSKARDVLLRPEELDASAGLIELQEEE